MHLRELRKPIILHVASLLVFKDATSPPVTDEALGSSWVAQLHLHNQYCQRISYLASLVFKISIRIMIDKI